MSASLLLYSPKKSNRYSYITKLIYKEILAFDHLNYCFKLDEFKKAEGTVKINYSTFEIKGALQISNVSNLLWEDTLQPQEFEIKWKDKLPYAFAAENQESKIPFDLYAFCFYLVSRYEEYLSFEADQHQRFSAKNSTAHQEGFLHLPVVNLWVEKLRLVLQEQFPKHKIPTRKHFSYQPSYDIDYAWMYRHKGLKRQVGGLLRDLLKGSLGKVIDRFSVLSGQREDPYFTFEYLDQLHAQYAHLQPIYFWLLGDYGLYDKNTNPELKVMQELIQAHQQHYQMGIHPSYASNEKEGKLEKEVTRLEQIIGQKVLKSRQHFLKLNFPSTYQNLLKVGIKADYSMGYAGQIGFRASIAHSYYWYDLENEEETSLRIHPFMFMDVTLKNYLQINKDAVLDEVKPIIEVTKKVGGELVTIWHNNSFCELEGWEGWRAVYEEVLKEIISNG
jgi:hypothetical protein